MTDTENIDNLLQKINAQNYKIEMLVKSQIEKFKNNDEVIMLISELRKTKCYVNLSNENNKIVVGIKKKSVL